MNVFERVLRKLRKDGIFGLAIAVFRRIFLFPHIAPSAPLTVPPTLEERFTEIYNGNFWESEESRSGPGSEMAYTESLRAWLIKNVPALGVNVLLDAPCGDFNWMKDVLRFINVDYIGLDIVPSLIENNSRRYSTNSIRFEVADICTDVLPSCDLIVVRDCLFHLSFKDVNKFLRNLSNLDYKYLLTTTHVLESDFQNSDIESGEFRLINLFSSPFGFDEANLMDRVVDSPAGEVPREMILVKKEFVPVSINSPTG